MRRPKKKIQPKNVAKNVSPYPQVFKRSPESLTREISTPSQRNFSEGTIIYGTDDNLPLRIAQAVDESPATKSCVETIAQFIKGSGFSNPDIQKIKIDKEGKTLWDLHCSLCDSLALFRGFATNFKYADNGRIKIIYNVSFESCRFKQPPELSKEITHIVYNPYFGTDQYKTEYSIDYPIYNIKTVGDDLKKLKPEERKKYPGQIYYYGKTTPLYRFYPVPDYWSAKKWIYIDGRIQEAHAENMDNGFFQSVQMTVIGDPNQPSENPKYQTEYTDEAGFKRLKSNKTVGEEFSIQMADTFSGSKKMGTVQVFWTANKDTAPKVEAFPTNANADLFLALQDITTKNITIATRVPSILANISEGVSLGSGGSEIQKAIELMQSRTSEYRTLLENFYNEVVLPNLEKPVAEKIQIVNFNPITTKVEIEDKFWEVLSPEEKRKFVAKNFPGIELVAAVPVAPAEQVLPDGDPEAPTAPAPVTGNESLKNWNISDINKIQKIIARYNLSLADPTNGKALTYEQAKQILLSYGLTDNEIDAWIVKPEEI